MRWREAPGARQVFVGQGVERALPPTGIVGGFEAGFEGGVAGNPGGVNLVMARKNIEAARRASEVLGEEVVPLAGPNWDEGQGVLNTDAIPGTALEAYTPYMRAAYDAETFRPDSGDERRIIGDKYKLARDLAGKSDEQFKRARLIDPSIPDMEEQRRQALAEANQLMDRAEKANTGVGGTIAWLAGEVMATIDPTTNPAWALNAIGLGGKTALVRTAGGGVAAGAQSLTEDLLPLAGLPSREEAMEWLGRDNDAVANALTAVALGTVLQGAGEVLAKGMAYGVSRSAKTAMRAAPPSERVVLDGISPDPSARVRNAQDLDATARQLDEGVPVTDIVPPAAALGDNASVMPNSRSSIEPVTRDTAPMTETELVARAKKLDPEAHKEYNKASKQVEKVNAETDAMVTAETTRIADQLKRIDDGIAEREAKIAKLAKGQRSTQLNELEALHMQREIAMDQHKAAMKAIADAQARKMGGAAAKLAKWEPLVERSRARARGEWEARATTLARATALREAPAAGKTQPTPAPEPPRIIGEPIERPLPPTSSPLVEDTGAGTVLERVQRVADKSAKEAETANKAWLTDVRRKLDDYEAALKSPKGEVVPEEIVLLDGTPVMRLTGLKSTKIEVGDGQELAAVYDLRKELAELDEFDEAKSVVMGCQMRS